MRLTIRGWTAVAVVGFAVAMGWFFGPRALDAVVTPLLVVLAVGLATTAWADRPRVDRRPVAEGFVGESRTVTVDLEADSTVAATIRDDVADGLSATGRTSETTLAGEERFSYDVVLEERGEHRVGPLTVAVGDVFGVVERRFGYPETSSVLVYPPIHDLRGEAASELRSLVDRLEERDREEFDRLREYERGDPLRDVHWRTVARRPDDDLVVATYATEETAGAVTVAGECTPLREDDLATAVASVATALLERGVAVGVALPDGAHPPDAGRDHHREVLARLATLEAGELDERTAAGADVLVRADANGTRVVLGDRELDYERLRGRRDAGGDDRRRTRRGAGDRDETEVVE